MMENSKKNSKVVWIILVILLVVSIGFNIYLFKDNKKGNIDFFNDYVIAINDYHIASEDFDLAGVNLNTGNWYIETGEYYYEFAIDYYDKAKEQLMDSKEFLTHAKLKLEVIKDDSPNQFYDKEITNRLEQIDILFDLVNQYYLLNDHMSKQLYEINYGSETEATRYFNLYNDLILEINDNLQKHNNISQKIDLAWDSNWYPLMESAA